MPDQTNQDPQKPTQDQPPPKQYATPRPGQSGERGTDERAPKIPDHIESSEGDDENQSAAGQGPHYDEDSSVKGSTGRSSADKRSSPSGQTGQGSGTPKPGGSTGQSSGSPPRTTPGSSGGGSSSKPGNPAGGQKDRDQ